MTPVQPSVASFANLVATLTPARSAGGERAFTITGIGDHDRPEWPFTINGMRTTSPDPELKALGHGGQSTKNWSSSRRIYSRSLAVSAAMEGLTDVIMASS